MEDVLRLLRQLVHERGITILLSSHLLNQVQSVCDRVGIFAFGQLIGVGTVPELAERFGFSLNHIEVVVDAGSGHDAELAALLGGIDGVAGAARGVAYADRTVAEAGVDAPPAGGEPGTTDEPSLVVPATPDERVWIVTTEPGREVHSMLSGILDALSAYRVVRIGRHEPTLDEIYRRAVEQHAERSDAGATEGVA